MLLLTALQLRGIRGHRRHELQLPLLGQVTPLPPRPNTAVTLLVSSANAAASRSWCSGRTTQNRDNVFMNNCWSYISWGPSANAAGSAARRSAEPKPTGSCVTAQAPHAYTECTATNPGLTEYAHHSNRPPRHANGSTLIIRACVLVAGSRAAPMALGLPHC